MAECREAGVSNGLEFAVPAEPAYWVVGAASAQEAEAWRLLYAGSAACQEDMADNPAD